MEGWVGGPVPGLQTACPGHMPLEPGKHLPVPIAHIPGRTCWMHMSHVELGYAAAAAG